MIEEEEGYVGDSAEKKEFDYLINSLIFFVSVVLAAGLMVLLISTRKIIYKKLPKALKNVLNKIMNMLMFNSVLRFGIMRYWS